MTVSTTQNKILYTTTGQTTYAFEFQVQDAATIQVYLNDVLQVGGYNVLLNPDQINHPGGAVQFDPTAPVAGQTLLIRRVIPQQQTINYGPYDPFPAEVTEEGFDKITLITQQNSEVASRSVQASGSDDGSTDLTLPAYVAGKGLMWDETEKKLTNSNVGLNDITDTAQASADASAASAAAAATSEGNASTSETNAANSEANALSYQNFAQQWSSAPADQTIDDGINPPGFSAFHWAGISQASSAALTYQGLWDPNSGAYPTSPGSGDLWIVSAEGTFDSKTWNPGDWLVRNAANTAWDQVPQTTAWDTITGVPNNVTNALNRTGDTATGKIILQANAESAIAPAIAADLTRKDYVDALRAVNAFYASTGVLQTGFGATVVRPVTGQYTVTFTAAFPDTDYTIQVCPVVGTATALAFSVQSKTTTGFTLYFAAPATGVLTNAAFDLKVTRNV